MTPETPRASTLSVWRIGCWIVLLLAAFGGWQYLRQGDYGHLIAASVVTVVCAATILRHSWARTPMRVIALLLAAWALVTGAWMLGQSGQFDQARKGALDPMLLLAIDQAQRSFQLKLVFMSLMLLLLLWLAWMLGRPRVAAQFRRLR